MQGLGSTITPESQSDRGRVRFSKGTQTFKRDVDSLASDTLSVYPGCLEYYHAKCVGLEKLKEKECADKYSNCKDGTSYVLIVVSLLTKII